MCESLCSGTLSSIEIFSEFFAAIPVCKNLNRSLRSGSWFSFLFGFGFLVDLVNNRSPRSIRSTCELDTSTGWEIYLHSDLPCESHCRLNTVMVGEVDELEEDVGWLRSCLQGVMDVEEWELEEELADKPGTTIGTKFSVLQCIRIPFFFFLKKKIRCGFWPLIHS